MTETDGRLVFSEDEGIERASKIGEFDSNYLDYRQRGLLPRMGVICGFLILLTFGFDQRKFRGMIPPLFHPTHRGALDLIETATDC